MIQNVIKNDSRGIKRTRIPYNIFFFECPKLAIWTKA